ncbi:MAG: aromatic ring-hydroxylating dioxygenase subunit alpha [Gammaproteobacteria bacterium]|nr:aromatic ring-hydroxylating dioxygenase subunit alpha [Gammaproteobacteria bacterium]
MRAAQNELLTRSGPGTPVGRLMRRYWQPAALSRELDRDRPVRPVNLMGERLVLFRDEHGELGLMDRHCAHRGADLCYGRLEDGGLRCPFHGWLFDHTGQCLQQPAEPAGSAFQDRIRLTSYPLVEHNGIIFAWMGEGEAPPLPDLDCLAAPDAYTFAFKGLIECNWLQALEVGIDPAHASFLHRFIEDEDPNQSYGKQFRDAVEGGELTGTRVLREFDRPEIQASQTGYGVRLTALRRLNDNDVHVRVTNQVFPHAIVIPMSREMTITQWHVPVDDTTCYWYAIFTSYGQPVDKETMFRQRLELYELPDYTPRVNKRNDYGFDPLEQRTRTYTGMGEDINVHDQWAVESQGPIHDRTREHLGRTDIGIVQYRRLLLQSLDALERGDALPLYGEPGPDDDPLTVDIVLNQDTWEDNWRRRALARRAEAPWQAPADAASS